MVEIIRLNTTNISAVLREQPTGTFSFLAQDSYAYYVIDHGTIFAQTGNQRESFIATRVLEQNVILSKYTDPTYIYHHQFCFAD